MSILELVALLQLEVVDDGTAARKVVAQVRYSLALGVIRWLANANDTGHRGCCQCPSTRAIAVFEPNYCVRLRYASTIS